MNIEFDNIRGVKVLLGCKILIVQFDKIFFLVYYLVCVLIVGWNDILNVWFFG